MNPRRTFQHVRDFQSRSFGRSDTSPGRYRLDDLFGSAAGDGRDVRGHVLDLLLGQPILERRHHAHTVRDALDDELVRGRGVVEVRADRAGRACVGERVAAAAPGRLEDLLPAAGSPPACTGGVVPVSVVSVSVGPVSVGSVVSVSVGLRGVVSVGSVSVGVVSVWPGSRLGLGGLVCLSDLGEQHHGRHLGREEDDAHAMNQPRYSRKLRPRAGDDERDDEGEAMKTSAAESRPNS